MRLLLLLWALLISGCFWRRSRLPDLPGGGGEIPEGDPLYLVAYYGTIGGGLLFFAGVLGMIFSPDKRKAGMAIVGGIAVMVSAQGVIWMRDHIDLILAVVAISTGLAVWWLIKNKPNKVEDAIGFDIPGYGDDEPLEPKESSDDIEERRTNAYIK